MSRGSFLFRPQSVIAFYFALRAMRAARVPPAVAWRTACHYHELGATSIAAEGALSRSGFNTAGFLERLYQMEAKQ